MIDFSSTRSNCQHLCTVGEQVQSVHYERSAFSAGAMSLLSAFAVYGSSLASAV